MSVVANDLYKSPEEGQAAKWWEDCSNSPYRGRRNRAVHSFSCVDGCSLGLCGERIFEVQHILTHYLCVRFRLLLCYTGLRWSVSGVAHIIAK